MRAALFQDRKSDGRAKIVSITTGLAGDKSLLKRGDVLLSINGEDLYGHERVAEALGNADEDPDSGGPNESRWRLPDISPTADAAKLVKLKAIAADLSSMETKGLSDEEKLTRDLPLWTVKDRIEAAGYDESRMPFSSDGGFDVMMLYRIFDDLEGTPELLKVTRMIRLLRLVKLARILRAGRIFQRLENALAINYNAMSVTKYVIVTLVFLHLSTCLLGISPQIYGSIRMSKLLEEAGFSIAVR